ncbi:hypothetical protein DXG01_007768 [Tephrocybe rancida]|nr:hypothetical protein DXG01_007768 [Tephrocybe rancida]
MVWKPSLYDPASYPSEGFSDEYLDGSQVPDMYESQVPDTYESFDNHNKSELLEGSSSVHPRASAVQARVALKQTFALDGMLNSQEDSQEFVDRICGLHNTKDNTPSKVLEIRCAQLEAELKAARMERDEAVQMAYVERDEAVAAAHAERDAVLQMLSTRERELEAWWDAVALMVNSTILTYSRVSWARRA